MKHQSYIRSLFVALCAFFVCTSALAGELNPFAFKVSSRLKGDVFNVAYYLNAPATSVKVTITLPNKQTVVYDCTDSLNTSRTSRVKGIYKLKISLREYINNNPDFRGKTDLPWSVDVKGGNTAEYPAVGNGQKLATKEVTSYSYNFYSPWSVDIDIDPYSDNFGTIYMVEKTDGHANVVSGTDMTQYYGWHTDEYKGGLYSFDPAFQNYPTMYNQTTDGGGTAYDYVDYDLNKVKAVRRDASMNANDDGHQGGAFVKNDLFGRVRIAYKPDHNNRVFMSFTPKKETSGNTSILLGEVKTNNYPLIGRNGGTDWFRSIIKANTYTESSKVGYYNNGNFVAGPNVVFDASVDGNLLRLCMISGAYQDRDITHRDSYRCDEYAIGLTATSITAPHKGKIFNMRRTESPDDVNFWYFNSRKLVPSCLGNIGGVKAHTGNGTCKYCAGADAVGFSNTYAHRGLEYDPDGKGFWHAQVRDNHNEIPSLVHFRYNETTTLYEVNFAEYICGRGGAAVRYDINGDRLAVAGGRFTTKTYTVASTTTDAHRTKNVWPNDITDNFPKPAVEIDWATIYTVNKANLHADMIDNYDDNTKADYKETSVANRAKVFTDSVLINVGCRMYDFAWDYADNLYICATGSHKFFALALPHAGKTVATPCKTDYYFNTPTQTLTVKVTPNLSCGNVVDKSSPNMQPNELDGNVFKYYYLSDAADGNNDDSTKVMYQLKAIPNSGYRFVNWGRIADNDGKSTHENITGNFAVSSYPDRVANFGINVWETATITPINEETTFRGVFVQRELDTESYSTICLPFNLETLVGTPYEGASVLEFTSEEKSNVDGDNRISLNFTEVEFGAGKGMRAGVPYLIQVKKAVSGEKMFWDVTCPDIDNQGQSVININGTVTFHALLNPTTFGAEDLKDMLFLTADNRLVTLYGQNNVNINGLRGYFTVIGGMAKNAEFVLNLPEKVVTSTPMVNIADSLQVTKYLWDGKIYIQKGNEVYDLSGARVK